MVAASWGNRMGTLGMQIGPAGPQIHFGGARGTEKGGVYFAMASPGLNPLRNLRLA